MVSSRVNTASRCCRCAGAFSARRPPPSASQLAVGLHSAAACVPPASGWRRRRRGGLLSSRTTLVRVSRVADTTTRHLALPRRYLACIRPSIFFGPNSEIRRGFRSPFGRFFAGTGARFRDRRFSVCRKSAEKSGLYDRRRVETCASKISGYSCTNCSVRRLNYFLTETRARLRSFSTKSPPPPRRLTCVV